MINDAGPVAGGDAAEVAKEVMLLLDLAVCRTRGDVRAGERTKDLICGILEEGKREVMLVGGHGDRVGPDAVRTGEGAAGMQTGWTAG